MYFFSNCQLLFNTQRWQEWIIPDGPVLLQQCEKNLRYFFVKNSIATPFQQQCFAIRVTDLRVIQNNGCNVKVTSQQFCFIGTVCF